jgi:hypothetical protein
MFDVDVFINDCRAALSESAPHLAVKEVVDRRVLDGRDELAVAAYIPHSHTSPG